MLLGTALFLAAGRSSVEGDFLTDAATPQGVFGCISTGQRGGRRGLLIAAYREVDYSNGVGGSQASAASNWIWGAC